ncbi:hypothetical protein Ahy_A08g038185 [Arachis hypogaea]|uniref:Uncharacterized protein n=1 Tax=Arachis hypogaea TaxID=3818 RepID=A0A445BSU5_ARAHY|nr:hypothetical protein Ahy_A08g038185 [Arachis hypogaea]
MNKRTSEKWKNERMKPRGHQGRTVKSSRNLRCRRRMLLSRVFFLSYAFHVLRFWNSARTWW